jgi:hypothetical protein
VRHEQFESIVCELVSDRCGHGSARFDGWDLAT